MSNAVCFELLLCVKTILKKGEEDVRCTLCEYGDIREFMKREYENELDEISLSTKKVIVRELLFWVIRWTIGFILIGIIVHYHSNLFWLWWVGIAFSLITPVISIITKKLINKKLAETKSKLAELEACVEDDG